MGRGKVLARKSCSTTEDHLCSLVQFVLGKQLTGPDPPQIWSKWTFLYSCFYSLEMAHFGLWLCLYLHTSQQSHYFQCHDHTHLIFPGGTFTHRPLSLQWDLGLLFLTTSTQLQSPGQRDSGTKPLPGTESVNKRGLCSCRAEQNYRNYRNCFISSMYHPIEGWIEKQEWSLLALVGEVYLFPFLRIHSWLLVIHHTPEQDSPEDRTAKARMDSLKSALCLPFYHSKTNLVVCPACLGKIFSRFKYFSSKNKQHK